MSHELPGAATALVEFKSKYTAQAVRTSSGRFRSAVRVFSTCALLSRRSLSEIFPFRCSVDAERSTAARMKPPLGRRRDTPHQGDDNRRRRKSSNISNLVGGPLGIERRVHLSKSAHLFELGAVVNCDFGILYGDAFSRCPALRFIARGHHGQSPHEGRTCLRKAPFAKCRCNPRLTYPDRHSGSIDIEVYGLNGQAEYETRKCEKQETGLPRPERPGLSRIGSIVAGIICKFARAWYPSKHRPKTENHLVA